MDVTRYRIWPLTCQVALVTLGPRLVREDTLNARLSNQIATGSVGNEWRRDTGIGWRTAVGHRGVSGGRIFTCVVLGRVNGKSKKFLFLALRGDSGNNLKINPRSRET